MVIKYLSWRCEEDSDEGYVAIDLGDMSDKSIEIEYGFSVKDAAGKEVVHHEPDTDEFAAYDGSNSSWKKHVRLFFRAPGLLFVLVIGNDRYELDHHAYFCAKIAPNQDFCAKIAR